MTKIPGRNPEQFSDAAFLANPLGAIPYPYPANMPTALWNITPIELQYALEFAEPLVYAQAVWRSATFDLRPELRGASMDRGQGQAYLTGSPPTFGPPVATQTVVQNTGTYPIWRPLGAAGKLWVQIYNLNFRTWARAFGFRVLVREYGSINDPNAIQQISDDEDITTDFVGTMPSAIAQFMPTGGGYPVRYWRCELRFQYRSSPLIDEPGWVVGGIPSNNFRLMASYY